MSEQPAESAYPERRPESKVPERFLFDMEVAGRAADDLRLRCEAIEAHIAKIMDRFVYQGVPVLHLVMRFTEGEEEELAKLAKAMERLSIYMPQLRELQRRRAVAEFAVKSPDEMAMTFGAQPDYDEELQRVLDEIDRRE